MELALLGKNPISAEQPTGNDVRNDAIFDQLQTEVQNAVSVGGGDWEKIVKLASEILNTKSKNLLVAGYLAVGLIHTQKSKGVMTGATIYMDMIENYWDTLYPEKKRALGRSRAIDWWAEKTAGAMTGLNGDHLSAEDAEALCGRLENLSRFLRMNLDDVPSFRPIMDAARAGVREKEAEPIPDDSFANTNTSSSSGNETVQIREILTESDAQKSLDIMREMAQKAAAFYANQDDSNPLVYHLNRMSIWTTVESLPSAIDNKTLLPPPDQELRDRLALLQNNGDSAGLLNAAEDASFQFFFWLDLHRMAATALGEMGEKYQAAAETVARDTAAFTERFPGIEQLQFSNGLPFADAETIAWLNTLKGAKAAPTLSDESKSVAAESKTEKENDEALKEIKKQLRSKKLAAAVDVYQERLSRLSAGREKFTWKMEFAKTLLKTKYRAILNAQVNQILSDINNYHLDQFDPPVALDGLKIALAAYETQSDPTATTNASAVLNQIARIDLSELAKRNGALK